MADILLRALVRNSSPDPTNNQPFKQSMSFISASNEKAVKWTIYGTTIVICLAVTVLNQKLLPHPSEIPSFIYKLPALNAVLNGTCSVLLIFSFLAIKKRNIERHKRLNITAFFLSSIFLISYVTAHYFIPDTKFGDVDHDGIMTAAESESVSGIKPLYLIILLTHIFLAVAVL